MVGFFNVFNFFVTLTLSDVQSNKSMRGHVLSLPTIVPNKVTIFVTVSEKKHIAVL